MRTQYRRKGKVERLFQYYAYGFWRFSLEKVVAAGLLLVIVSAYIAGR